MSTRRPRACAAATSASRSANVPNSGCTSLKFDTSYPKSLCARGEGARSKCLRELAHDGSSSKAHACCAHQPVPLLRAPWATGRRG
jgi:hypothetical protein